MYSPQNDLQIGLEMITFQSDAQIGLKDKNYLTLDFMTVYPIFKMVYFTPKRLSQIFNNLSPKWRWLMVWPPTLR